MILVTGISGVGKTHTIEAYVSRHPSFVHLTASDLLARAGYRTAVNDSGQAAKNQLALLNILASSQMPHSDRIILDGHAVLEGSDGGIFEVPTSIAMELRPTAIVTICDEGPRLRARRRHKRVVQDTNWNVEIQLAEIQRSREWARLLNVPFYTVTSGDIDGFATAIANLGVQLK